MWCTRTLKKLNAAELSPTENNGTSKCFSLAGLYPMNAAILTFSYMDFDCKIEQAWHHLSWNYGTATFGSIRHAPSPEASTKIKIKNSRWQFWVEDDGIFGSSTAQIPTGGSLECALISLVTKVTNASYFHTLHSPLPFALFQALCLWVLVTRR